MHRSYTCVSVALLVAQPALAAESPTAKAQREQQIREVVFQNYPPRALAAGEQGAVFFIVSLDKDAHPTTCEVTHGSGHPPLDIETCQLIVLHAVFKSVRDASGRLVKQRAEGVVNWTIPGRQPVPINPVLLTGAAKPEKQVCKMNVRMGTLSAIERICLTPSEWAKQSEQMKEPYAELQGRKGSTAGVSCIQPSGC